MDEESHPNHPNPDNAEPARQNESLEYLRKYVEAYTTYPSLAFWRAVEALQLPDWELARPSLDVGAWDGSFTAIWLNGRDPMDVGMDLVPTPTPFTDRAYRSLVTGDAQDLPFDNGSFGSVVCNSVIEHIPDTERVLREFGRVLRPEGVLFLTTPSVFFRDLLRGVVRAKSRGDLRGAEEYARSTDARLQHLHYYPLEEWERMLKEHGLVLRRHRYYLPPAAASFWDGLDRLLTRRLRGREVSHWLRRADSVLSPGLKRRAYFRVLRKQFLRALEEAQREGTIGASLYIEAIRR